MNCRTQNKTQPLNASPVPDPGRVVSSGGQRNARVRVVLGLLVVLVCGLLAPKSVAAEVPRLDPATEERVDRALVWLAARQDADGSWSTDKYQHNTAVTAFALLAFLSRGHVPEQGPYGRVVSQGVNFLLDSTRDDGYLVGQHGGSMYCHAMATLVLAEVWGMSGDERVRTVLKRAVDLIIRCQNDAGGWRYEPAPTGADISVTIMQVMALRAAKNSGLYVPDATLERALVYIRSLYHPDSGGFGYERPSDPPGFARSAAGVCVLQLTGEYEASEIPKVVEYLRQNFDTNEHFWYGHYYAAHALHQIGGSEWEAWYDRIKKLLLEHQLPEGHWIFKDQEGVGAVYQTSIAVIVLSVPAEYLPIFQR